MKLLKIANADYVANYVVLISFNDGVRGEVDLQQKIFTDKRPIFQQLRQTSYFKSFNLNSMTIEWDNGLDLAPEFLYQLLLQQNKTVHDQV